MKKSIIILMLMSIIISVNAQMIQRDKQLHLGAGAVVGAWGSIIPQNQTGVKPFLFGVGASAVAGAGKELVDLGGFGTPDIKDFGATVIGGIVSVGAMQGIKAILKAVKKHKSYNNVYIVSNKNIVIR